MQYHSLQVYLAASLPLMEKAHITNCEHLCWSGVHLWLKIIKTLKQIILKPIQLKIKWLASRSLCISHLKNDLHAKELAALSLPFTEHHGHSKKGKKEGENGRFKWSINFSTFPLNHIHPGTGWNETNTQVPLKGNISLWPRRSGSF